jgi:hypothetical protein
MAALSGSAPGLRRLRSRRGWLAPCAGSGAVADRGGAREGGSRGGEGVVSEATLVEGTLVHANAVLIVMSC